jgi:pimeloyl-ACP methyl ester carboxylesterase
LILCDTRAAADAPEARKARFVSADRATREGTGFLAQDMPARLYAQATQERRPELIQATQAVIRGTSGAGAAAALRGMAERPDASDWLPEIRVPALAIVGVEDAISPPDEMRAIASALPQARLVVVPNAGHMSPQEAPEAVNQAIHAFLDG